MLTERIVTVSDPLAHENVMRALAGPGAPVGVVTCRASASAIIVTVDTDRTSLALIDDLIAVASTFVPRTGDAVSIDALARRAGVGLGEPDLDGSRVIETYVS